MPLKIRDLETLLKQAGFKNRGGKGSHRNYEHPSGVKITISGNPGRDAKRYQEQETAAKIAESRR